MALLTAIGLMSDPSFDGVSAAVVRTDGEAAVEVGPSRRRAYDRAAKVMCRRAAKAALEGRDAAKDVVDAENAVTRAHAAAAVELLDKAGLSAGEVDVVGLHGHTILHRSAARSIDGRGRTWQIGDAGALSDAVGAPVVSNFRAADVALGGEGAPLASVYHAARARAYAAASGAPGPVAVLDLGEVATVTYAGRSARNIDLVAFDCGPAGGLLDAWMTEKAGEPMDRDGAAARAGRVRRDVLRALLAHDFLRRPPPKRLDRYDFTLDAVGDLSLFDGAATLTAFAAACARVSLEHMPEPPALWIVVGPARRNPALMEALRKAVDAPVRLAEDAGWRGDDADAESVAYLAVRSLRKLPLSYPKTTGAPRPVAGGELVGARDAEAVLARGA